MKSGLITTLMWDNEPWLHGMYNTMHPATKLIDDSEVRAPSCLFDTYLTVCIVEVKERGSY